MQASCPSSRSCLQDGQLCNSDSMCCYGSRCREVHDGFRACVRSPEGLKTGDTCERDDQCGRGFCKRLPCEGLTYIGVDKAMCGRMGVCASAPSISNPSDFR